MSRLSPADIKSRQRRAQRSRNLAAMHSVALSSARLRRLVPQQGQVGPDKQKAPGTGIPEAFTNRNSGQGSNGGRYAHGRA